MGQQQRRAGFYLLKRSPKGFWEEASPNLEGLSQAPLTMTEQQVNYGPQSPGTLQAAKQGEASCPASDPTVAQPAGL